MLTDSYNVTDIAVLCGSARLPYDIVRPLYEHQLEFNYLEEELIRDGSCEIDNGRIKIRSQCYSTLIVDDVAHISPEAEHFAENGGTVIVYDPDGIYHNKNIISAASYEEILSYLKKDLIITPACKDLRVSHIVKNGEHFYILVNEGEEPVRGDIEFSCDGTAAVFDPWKGAEVKLNRGAISLDRRESLIICAGISLSQRSVLHCADRFGIPKREMELKDWYIGSERIKLGSWTENERLKDFCGTVSYTSEFEIDLYDADKLILDMGAVAEQAEVYLNDSYVGYRLWKPYAIDVTDHIRNGKNSLRIEVTNSLANKYSKERLSSGLLDRVVLKVFKNCE